MGRDDTLYQSRRLRPRHLFVRRRRSGDRQTLRSTISPEAAYNRHSATVCLTTGVDWLRRNGRRLSNIAPNDTSYARAVMGGYFRVGKQSLWLRDGASATKGGVRSMSSSNDHVTFLGYKPGLVLPGDADARIVLEGQDLVPIPDSQIATFVRHIDNSKLATTEQLTEVAVAARHGWIPRNMPLRLVSPLYQDQSGSCEQPRGHRAFGHVTVGPLDLSVVALLRAGYTAKCP
jgi:hypothetical protein